MSEELYGLIAPKSFGLVACEACGIGHYPGLDNTMCPMTIAEQNRRGFVPSGASVSEEKIEEMASAIDDAVRGWSTSDSRRVLIGNILRKMLVGAFLCFVGAHGNGWLGE